MRLLVVSNVSGSVDRIVDVLQSNHNITAKESNSTIASMAKTAADGIQNGTYDAVIVIARDPIGAGMVLNKQEGLNAALCGTADDVKVAKSDGANVIVIRDINSDELHEIVLQVGGMGGMMRGIKMPQVKMPQLMQKQEPEEMAEPVPQSRVPQPKKVPTFPKFTLKKNKPAAEEEENEEDEEDAMTSPEGGIVGEIKNFLGLR